MEDNKNEEFIESAVENEGIINDEKEELLKYDNTKQKYNIVIIVLIILIPLTIMIIQTFALFVWTYNWKICLFGNIISIGVIIFYFTLFILYKHLYKTIKNKIKFKRLFQMS